MNDSLDAALARARAQQRLPEPPMRGFLRRRAGLSQQDIAKALSVTREAVAQWEAGRRTPRPETAIAYLDLLNRLAQESLR
jgi:DNA-binding XRE family transcriptional regulator